MGRGGPRQAARRGGAGAAGVRGCAGAGLARAQGAAAAELRQQRFGPWTRLGRGFKLRVAAAHSRAAGERLSAQLCRRGPGAGHTPQLATPLAPLLQARVFELMYEDGAPAGKVVKIAHKDLGHAMLNR